jgi:hypothetical protein
MAGTEFYKIKKAGKSTQTPNDWLTPNKQHVDCADRAVGRQSQASKKRLALLGETMKNLASTISSTMETTLREERDMLAEKETEFCKVMVAALHLPPPSPSPSIK